MPNHAHVKANGHDSIPLLDICLHIVHSLERLVASNDVSAKHLHNELFACRIQLMMHHASVTSLTKPQLFLDELQQNCHDNPQALQIYHRKCRLHSLDTLGREARGNFPSIRLSPLRRRRRVRRHSSRRCFQERGSFEDSLPLCASFGARIFLSHLHPLPGFQFSVSFQRFLLQLDHPFIQVFLSSFGATAGISSHHPPPEFFFKLLLAFGFEARHPSAELPRLLLLGLEALLLLHTCSPEVSSSQQLCWPLIHELLSR